MRVKHWQGYGSVDMKVISRKTVGDEKTIVVRVTGNHEWGIERKDVYDVHRWICSRFAKDCESYSDIIELRFDDYYKRINGVDTEICDYTITYRI